MKARALKLNVAKVAQYVGRFFRQNSFVIFSVYGVGGFFAGIWVNKLGGLPTWIMPVFYSFSLPGSVVLFDVIELIFKPSLLATPHRIGEFDPNPFNESDGRKQGFMWGSTVLLLVTTDFPLTAFILPILVGIVLAIFDEVEEVYYTRWFWGSVLTGAVIAVANAITFGYWWSMAH